MISVNRECKKCLEVFPLTLEYFYKSKNSKGGFNTSCKDCVKEQAAKWRDSNPETYKKSYNKRDSRVEVQQRLRHINEQRSKSGKYLEWQRKNKDKIKGYREKRAMHKNHDISEDELLLIYEYSNSSCMYCGKSEEEAILRYGQKLHKDHAYNSGSDGIDNCVLACKGCNSSKHNKDWEEWFVSSDCFEEERYRVIEHWLDIWK